MIGLGHYLTLAAILFTIGIFGIFLNRKNVIIILMSVELILLAVNINLVAFSSFLGDLVGQVYALLVLTVAAAEAAIGLVDSRGLLPKSWLDRRRRHQFDEGLRVYNVSGDRVSAAPGRNRRSLDCSGRRPRAPSRPRSRRQKIMRRARWARDLPVRRRCRMRRTQLCSLCIRSGGPSTTGCRFAVR